MGAVHIGIGHDDDLVIAQLVLVKLLADARAQRDDDRLELVVAIDLVYPCLLHVQHLAPQGEDGLEPAVAPLGGGAACGVALHDVQLGQLRVVLVAVTELVGHGRAAQHRLAPDGLPRLPRRFPGAVGGHGLVQNGARHHRMLLQIHRQLVGDDAVHQRADMGVAQLGLGLSLELRLRQLHGDHGGDTLAHVLAGHLVAVLYHVVFQAVGVEHAGQRGLEARLVHAALRSMDVVGEGHQRLVITVVVLHGDLRRAVALGAGEIDDFLVEGGFVAVDIGDELPDAALVAHGLGLLPAGSCVADCDAQAGVQERLLPHAGVQRLVVVLQRVEHLRVGLEGHGGAGMVGVADDLHLLGDVPAGELHLVNFSVLVYLHRQPLAQGVDHAGAHAVQTAGDLVAAAAELAAGVQHGEHHLQRGTSRLRLHVHGDAASVVGDGDGVAGVDGHGDIRAVPGQRLVDGVVHDLIDQMVQSAGAGGADIHTGALAHRLQALQHLYFRCVIFRVHHGSFHVCHALLSFSLRSFAQRLGIDLRQIHDLPVIGMVAHHEGARYVLARGLHHALPLGSL